MTDATGAALAMASSASDDLHPEYRAFLEAKIPLAMPAGLPCSLDDVPDMLADGRPMKPHIRHIVRWAVEGGRRALFESFGLHKTMQQLLICDIILRKLEIALGSKPDALVVVPLNVRREFIRDAQLLGLDVRFIQSDAEMDASGDEGGIFLTNYESVREGKVSVSRFCVACLDEADVLRSFGSKTYQEFLPLFETVPYRFVATATPAPNRYKEMIHYAGFLGIMDTGQALTRFFQRNSEKAGDLTLYEHKRDEFFTWVNSWAVIIRSPADICRCSCHVELTSQDKGSDASLLSNGIVIGESAAGDASAIVEASTSQLQITSGQDVSSAADACAPSMAEKEPGHIQSGQPCAPDAEIPVTKIGITTAAEAYPSANVGSNTPTSSETWESPAQTKLSSALTMGSDTSPETADGPAERNRLGTHVDPSCCASEIASSQCPHGLTSSALTTGHFTNDTGAAGASSASWDHSCDSCRCTEGYALPPITVRWHSVEADIADAEPESNGQGRLIRDTALGVVEASREKRRTLDARIEKAAEIVAAAPDDHFIIWHDLEDERRALEKSLPGCETVYGAQKLDVREDIVTRFADGDLALIGAKPVMLGGGVNLQRHCHRAIFTGVGFKFRDFIQAIHRIQRFGQTEPVEIDIIYSETETEVVRALQEKWKLHEELSATMSAMIRKYGLEHSAAKDGLERSIGCTRQEASGNGWTLAHNDCVAEAERLEEGSLDLIVTSIPFSNHYEYTPSYNDFGHTDDDAHFFAQMDFLTPQLLRALAPGRLACIHVKDRILFGSVTGQGVPTVNPFHAKCIDHYMRHGFQFMGMITVVTDVVRENNQTYRLSYSEMLKDGTKMGVGSPEYVLLMRKPQSDRSRGYADTPVTKSADDYSLARWQVDAHAFWRSSGERPLTIPELWEVEERFAHMATGKIVKRFREETRDLIYSFRSHVDIGEQIEARGANDQRGHLPRTFMALNPGSHHPDVWDDVVRMRTLNAEQVQKGREKHVCPLQFDIVDRLIERYSAKGDLVYDPFCGLGTVPMRAILSGRRGAGSELNPDYWAHSVAYLREAEDQMAVPSLFDLLDLEQGQPTERAA
ncbi:DNA methyltransferase [Sphingobium sp. Cam5-1]|uniref:DNA methyltransferase n=1 Tax=Sphingobium sp. Cam5-1 TaxID=2789327 RepID=UPI001E2DA00E|nr:DNA methyltransferase [Sphingobium sp. Cam5-1]